MNTFKSLVLIFLLLTGALKATNGAADILKSASQKIQNGLTMPLELKQDHGSQTIRIYFSVNENGDVIKVNVKTKNLEAKRHLEEQFRQLNFKGLKPAVSNSIDVNFKVC